MDFKLCKIASYNCRSLKSSLEAVKHLCQTCETVMLQETWRTPEELPVLNQIHPDLYGMGTSAMDSGGSILVGRPYGGIAVLRNRRLAHSVNILQ